MHIWSSNFENFQPDRFADPAACVQTFLNGVVSIHLPTHESWIKAYSDDTEMSAISSFVMNSGTISQHSLEAAHLNPNYHQALRQSHIKWLTEYYTTMNLS
jgi:hypothetical protein